MNSGLCAEVREGENLIPIMLDSIRMALFLYANAGNKPIPVHCRKGDMECKDCIDDENYDIARSISSCDATRGQETNKKDNI